MKLLLDFSDEAQVAPFTPVDDVVMGGQSQSQLHAHASHASFQGTVSLAQGGGFASVQCALEADWSAHAGLQLRVRGDGQRYAFNLYNAPRPRRIAYRYLFEAPPAWTSIAVPFHALQPRFRGRAVPEADPFDPAAVRGLSFLIGDQQAGAFRLDLAAIHALPAGTES
ncbi:MAG: CIA30 family protein [Bacteroidetes bacterium]|jgi:monofunctional biosynthetic peptidoglycan transglycosylase|nr:CIA30 family protein [Bacteroidota bacterium]